MDLRLKLPLKLPFKSRGAQAVVQITEGVIWKQLLYYFFPILFGTFFQQLYNTADAMIVGQFVGTQALAAVGGATGSLVSFCVNLFVGLSTGATIILAQAYGARNMEDVGATVHTAAGLVLAAGLALTVCGYAAAPWALRAMDTPADVLQPAILYLRIYMLGTIPAFFYNIGSGILRAVGDTRRPLYFLIIACLTNIVLDVLLVAVLRLGVAGAALATILSQLVSAVLVYLCLTRTEAAYRLDPRRIRCNGRLLGSILRVGVPAGLQSNMYAISNILIQSAINGFGTATVAAWTAFGKIDGFYWMILGAFGMSITTFAGQNFGAQKYARIRESVRVCLGLGFGSAALMSVLYSLFGANLLGLFTRDAAVLQVGEKIVAQMAPWYCAFVCIEILAGVTRGCGCSLAPMLITCGGVCVLRVVWVLFLLPLRPQLSTVLVSYPVSWLFTSALFIVYYLQGGWLRTQIRKMGYAPEPPRALRKKG